VIYIHDSPKDEGKVFLDPNTLSQNNTIVIDDPLNDGIGFSNDGLIMAYSIDDINCDFRKIKFKHVQKGALYKERNIK
jgi:Prolyl oligopeptidase, N-terminal beta-propeller domain